MNSTARNSGLRRGSFAAGLAATAIAAALSPDWSSVLKAQGYYDSVDLSIAAVAPEGFVFPDTDLVLGVSVVNHGPDTARRVRTIAAAHNLTYVRTQGCGPEPQYPQCMLWNDLPAGHGQSYDLVMHVPAEARNHVQFSISVASDGVETVPGDEIVLLKRAIYVPLDLITEIACAPLQQGAAQTRVAQCSIRFRNTGSWGARAPTLQASAAPAGPRPVNWSCESSPAALCASAQANGSGYSLRPYFLPPSASVTFFADIPLNPAAPVITLDANATLNGLMGETEVNPANNAVSYLFEPSLFADGFDTPL